MAKREFIDIEQVITEIKNMDNNGCITRAVNHVCEDIRMIPTVSEREIVKPYLTKILNTIVNDNYLQKNMSGDIWERIEDIVNNVLSKDGEKG